MDKVNNSSRQSTPLWERQRESRGHRSAVDGALKAHRQRSMEREARVQERLNMVKSLQSQFFPTPVAKQAPQSQFDAIQAQSFQQAPANQAPLDVANIQVDIPNIDEVQAFNPIEMDEIYSEASLGSISDNAMAIVSKDISSPEEAPSDEVPKGSYVDYTV